jgi:hypothetical protein
LRQALAVADFPVRSEARTVIKIDAGGELAAATAAAFCQGSDGTFHHTIPSKLVLAAVLHGFATHLFVGVEVAKFRLLEFQTGTVAFR